MCITSIIISNIKSGVCRNQYIQPVQTILYPVLQAASTNQVAAQNDKNYQQVTPLSQQTSMEGQYGQPYQHSHQAQMNNDQHGKPYPDRVAFPSSGEQLHVTWVNSPHDFWV